METRTDGKVNALPSLHFFVIVVNELNDLIDFLLADDSSDDGHCYCRSLDFNMIEELDANGDGVDKFEFVSGVLIQLG
jgi:hypothetical protein